jgi:hypothetical protein
MNAENVTLAEAHEELARMIGLAKCDWPEGVLFAFHDNPGAHDPCYVVMPGGAMLALNHHAGEGVDIARARFIIDACNAALLRMGGGWKLVPVEAANGQCSSGLTALISHAAVNYADMGTMREIYRAMTKAAPEPPHGE